MPARPDVVVFDVIETLADLTPVADRLAAAGLDRGLLPSWFTRILRDGMALTLSGSYAGFRDVATAALRAESRSDLPDETVTGVLEGFAGVEPQPDAVAAVRAAAEAGLRVFTLSNGAAATTSAFLERIGVADLVEHVLSIDEVRAWKPAPAPYELAVRTAGVPASRVAMVAVHSWDLAGARAVGLTTGWCPRLEGRPVPTFGRADVIADRLDDVVRELAALGG